MHTPTEIRPVPAAAPVPSYSKTRTVSPPPPRSIAWGAIFAGAIVATTVQILWALFVDIGMGVGIVTLFLGGWVTGRLAKSPRRFDVALHGLVTWSLVTFVGALLLTGVVARRHFRLETAVLNSNTQALPENVDRLDELADQIRDTADDAGFAVGQHRKSALPPSNPSRRVSVAVCLSALAAMAGSLAASTRGRRPSIW